MSKKKPRQIRIRLTEDEISKIESALYAYWSRDWATLRHRAPTDEEVDLWYKFRKEVKTHEPLDNQL